jgi:hypothetical protein
VKARKSQEYFHSAMWHACGITQMYSAMGI